MLSCCNPELMDLLIMAIRDLIHFTVDKALECIHVCLFVSFKPLFKDFRGLTDYNCLLPITKAIEHGCRLILL